MFLVKKKKGYLGALVCCNWVDVPDVSQMCHICRDLQLRVHWAFLSFDVGLQCEDMGLLKPLSLCDWAVVYSLPQLASNWVICCSCARWSLLGFSFYLFNHVQITDSGRVASFYGIHLRFYIKSTGCCTFQNFQTTVCSHMAKCLL